MLQGWNIGDITIHDSKGHHTTRHLQPQHLLLTSQHSRSRGSLCLISASSKRLSTSFGKHFKAPYFSVLGRYTYRIGHTNNPGLYPVRFSKRVIHSLPANRPKAKRCVGTGSYTLFHFSVCLFSIFLVQTKHCVWDLEK